MTARKREAKGEVAEAERELKRPWRETLEALIIAAIFLRFANTFVVQTFYIPSGSMEETLLIGDHLFVNRFIYGPSASPLEDELLPRRDIRRGDIVIFRSPQEPEIDIVKRCIGLPGDTIRVRDKQLFVNEQEVDDESYALHTDERTLSATSLPGELRNRDQFGPVTVPADHYFCMGDNRDFSYDSRFWGPVPTELVKGRAAMIYWSFDYGEDALPGSPGAESGHRLQRLVKTLFLLPVNTRWERTFQVIR